MGRSDNYGGYRRLIFRRLGIRKAHSATEENAQRFFYPDMNQHGSRNAASECQDIGHCRPCNTQTPELHQYENFQRQANDGHMNQIQREGCLSQTLGNPVAPKHTPGILHAHKSKNHHAAVNVFSLPASDFSSASCARTHPLRRGGATAAHPGPAWHWPPTTDKGTNAGARRVRFYVCNGPKGALDLDLRATGHEVTAVLQVDLTALGIRPIADVATEQLTARQLTFMRRTPPI
jgi:hypothetical protein